MRLFQVNLSWELTYIIWLNSSEKTLWSKEYRNVVLGKTSPYIATFYPDSQGQSSHTKTRRACSWNLKDWHLRHFWDTSSNGIRHLPGTTAGVEHNEGIMFVAGYHKVRTSKNTHSFWGRGSTYVKKIQIHYRHLKHVKFWQCKYVSENMQIDEKHIIRSILYTFFNIFCYQPMLQHHPSPLINKNLSIIAKVQLMGHKIQIGRLPYRRFVKSSEIKTPKSSP